MVVSFGCASHMRCDEMLMLNVESVVTMALCTSPSFKRWGRLHRRASTAFKNASRVASGSKDAARHSSLACDLVRERFTSGLRCDQSSFDARALQGFGDVLGQLGLRQRV